MDWRATSARVLLQSSRVRDANCGGTTLAPDVGVYEDIHELDFASLSPDIIRTRNLPRPSGVAAVTTRRCPDWGTRSVSPTAICRTCSGQLIDARSEIKPQIPDASAGRREQSEAASSTIEWILVSRVGYQGFSNAKFAESSITSRSMPSLVGSSHPIVETKAALEDAGWRVLHGIVDSIWVTPPETRERRPLTDVAAGISAASGIELESECTFD